MQGCLLFKTVAWVCRAASPPGGGRGCRGREQQQGAAESLRVPGSLLVASGSGLPHPAGPTPPRQACVGRGPHPGLLHTAGELRN